jgi:hypothetical protein
MSVLSYWINAASVFTRRDSVMTRPRTNTALFNNEMYESHQTEMYRVAENGEPNLKRGALIALLLLINSVGSSGLCGGKIQGWISTGSVRPLVTSS